MSTRTATVRRQKHNDQNIRMVTQSKAHLRRLSKIHDELIDNAVEATQEVVALAKEYNAELQGLEVTPSLAMIAGQIQASNDKHKVLHARIEAISSKNSDPLGQLTEILLDLNDESLAITSSISDPLMDVMNDMNKRLPVDKQFDLAPVEELISQLDNDIAANSPVAQLPETNRVMQ